MSARASIAVCLSLITLSLAQTQQVVPADAQGSGSIDWAKRFIVATGIGAPNPDLPQSAQHPAALRAAQQLVLENTLETIKGIYLNSTTTVSNFLGSNDQTARNVNSTIQRFQQQENPRTKNDGSVEITIRVPLDGTGSIGDIILSNSVAAKPSVTAFEKSTVRKEVVFTGLIIDCKGLSVKPSLSPRVIDENAREVYSSSYVSREWAVKNGIAGYANDVLTASKLTDRIGANPDQIKAKKASGSNSTDIVIDNKDADNIRSTSKNLDFLSECRVILVID